MKVRISVETLTEELFTEMRPLGQKCWKEATLIKGESCAFYGDRDYTIEPDFDQYKKLDQIGSLIIVSLRDENSLVGFIAGFIHVCMHHKHLRGAIGDTIYIEPEYRSYAPVLINKFLDEARNLKADIIGWPTTPDGYVYNILKSLGFVADDVVMEKRLCV